MTWGFAVGRACGCAGEDQCEVLDCFGVVGGGDRSDVLLFRSLPIYLKR